MREGMARWRRRREVEESQRLGLTSKKMPLEEEQRSWEGKRPQRLRKQEVKVLSKVEVELNIMLSKAKETLSKAPSEVMEKRVSKVL